MLRHFLQKTQTRLRRWRGPAMICVGLVLMNLWLAAGCDLTAQRIPPTPPTAETPPTAPDDRTTAPTRTSTVPAEPPTSETTQAPRFQYDPDTFALIPWAPIEAPPGAWERTQKIVEPLYQQYRTGQMSQEEYDEKIHQINVVALGLLPYTRFLAESGHYDAPTYADRALAENPDDFETLITWVEIGGREFSTYGEERAAVLRRLYEMNPHHPYVLHQLALCIYGKQPAEALGYAQKAQQLEPRYLPYGVDGLCYYQMGEYEQAVTALERAHAAAPARMKLATLQRVEDARKTLRFGKAGEDVRQQLRDKGLRLMGPLLFVRH